MSRLAVAVDQTFRARHFADKINCAKAFRHEAERRVSNVRHRRECCRFEIFGGNFYVFNVYILYTSLSIPQFFEFVNNIFWRIRNFTVD
jgi:hypothetical protein